MAFKKIGIAGAGFAGAVLAHELASTGKYHIHIFDDRSHVAGNCYTVRDSTSGIMLHNYGPHIFNTSRDDVWKYVNRFATFGQYTNRVKAITARGVFSLPINLLTINQFFQKHFSPEEAKHFIGSLGDKSIDFPETFEQQALKFLGRELYENFFYGYTKKQWGVEPSALPASILQRLPVRFNYDDNYYTQKYQGIPIEGYTAIVDKLLDHPRIDVFLNQAFDSNWTGEFDYVFYSGPMDAYFNYSLGRLQYRTLVFERFETDGDYQGNPVINYCEESIPYTRISEHKHFAPWEEHQSSVCFREYSKITAPGNTPFYPMRLAADKQLLAGYMDLAFKEEKVSFIGRLGTYRYLDMHVVIGESLDLAKTCLTSAMENWPKFSGSPLPSYQEGKHR